MHHKDTEKLLSNLEKVVELLGQLVENSKTELQKEPVKAKPPRKPPHGKLQATKS
jgi:hypothetical protein